MVSNFFLLFERLNFSSLSDEKKKKMINKTRLSVTKVVDLFEYRKINKGY